MVEVGVLRMYTTVFCKPWNDALRSGDDERVGKWATCIVRRQRSKLARTVVVAGEGCGGGGRGRGRGG
jgi:hypothetical protein